MSKALRRYIKLVLEQDNARVPTQLMSPEEAEEAGNDRDKDEDEGNNVDEFTAVAGAMGGNGFGGYTSPMGSSSKSKPTTSSKKKGESKITKKKKK